MDEKVKEATNSRYLELAARTGYAVNGVLHLAYATICWQILAGPSAQTGQDGPISRLAGTAVGAGLLWIGAGSCVALSLWQLAKAALEKRGTDLKTQLHHRGVCLARACAYAALAFTLAHFVLSGPATGGRTNDITAAMMRSALGSIMLIAVGVGILVVAAYCIYKGMKRKFLADLKTTGEHHVGPIIRALGIAGYAARGIALGAVGVLVIVAAGRPHAATNPGLDAALQALSHQPFGQWVVGGVGMGLFCYGIYSFTRTKFAKM